MDRFLLPEAVAVVTGASRGIGRAIALGMAGAGADVIGVARDSSALDALGADVEAVGRRFQALPVDLAAEDGPLQAAERAWAWRGRVDVLVNAAGVLVRSEVPDVSVEQWNAQFAVNVRAPFFLTQAIGGRMHVRGGGAVVNVTSVAAEVTTRAPTVYASSKAALVQMTRVLAVRWAPVVRVNAVGPSYVRTALNEAWLDEEANHRFVLDRTPLGRVGEPGDVVGAVVFLASPAASYVTGQHLLVDGGWTAQ
jgi:NAD(P)-dependent dehydrogenase (short-subunit alcohol dehydrogenase family)